MTAARTGSTAGGCYRCHGHRGPTVVTFEKASFTNSEAVNEMVRLCAPCRRDAAKENAAALKRRRTIEGPPTV